MTTIGRGSRCAVRLADPSVSRLHARARATAGGVVVEDAGSAYGTFVDGVRVDGPRTVGDGARVRVGDQVLVVERRRGDGESLRTLAVVGADDRGPRLVDGVVVKRLAASEGAARWVVRDRVGERGVRLGEEGALVALLDGRRDVAALMAEAERALGADGPARLVALLAALADRGMLAGVEGGAAAGEPRRWARWLTPREKAWPEAGARFAELYARGWRVLFTPGAFVCLAAIAVAGLVAFMVLVARTYGTPFVVARHVGVGGLVFLVGRLAVAAVHESAHALTMVRYGRRPGRAGLKLVLVFPYAFVDTSEMWLSGRRARMAVTAAGPVSDVTVGGVFALLCLASAPGTVRDVCFQLAFGAYLGALTNLNPLVDRDGYNLLADALREPNLRRDARAELGRRLRGEGGASRMLGWYAVAGVAWSAVAVALTVGVTLRYRGALTEVLGPEVVWLVLPACWLAVAAPAIGTVAGPLRDRMRSGDHG